MNTEREIYSKLRRDKVTARFTLFNFLANIAFLINDIVIEHVSYLIIIDYCVVTFYGLLYLFYKMTKKQEITAVLLTLSLNFWLYFNADLYGKQSIIFIFFFTLSFMTFFLFDYKNKLRFYIFLSLPVIALMVLLVTDFSVFNETFQADEIESTAILSIAGNLVLYYVFINGIINSINTVDHLFSSEKVKLKQSENQLSQLNHQVNEQNNNLNHQVELMKKELLEKQKELDLVHIHAEENERKRISNEIHDSLGVLLSISRMKLEVIEKKIADENIAECIALINQAIDEIKIISLQLQPVMFEELGVVKILEDLLIKINNSEKAPLFRLINNGYNNQLNKEQELLLFRVIMEKINNILKHAQATEAIIQLVADKEFLRLSIEDNGVGYDSKKASMGLGKFSSEYRVQLMNGIIQTESNSEKGTLVIIQIPLT